MKKEAPSLATLLASLTCLLERDERAVDIGAFVERSIGRIILDSYLTSDWAKTLRNVPVHRLRTESLVPQQRFFGAYVRSSMDGLISRVCFGLLTPFYDFEQRLNDRTRKLEESLRVLASGQYSRRSIDGYLQRYCETCMFNPRLASWERGVISAVSKSYASSLLGEQTNDPVREFRLFMDVVVALY